MMNKFKRTFPKKLDEILSKQTIYCKLSINLQKQTEAKGKRFFRDVFFQTKDSLNGIPSQF